MKDVITRISHELLSNKCIPSDIIEVLLGGERFYFQSAESCKIGFAKLGFYEDFFRIYEKDLSKYWAICVTQEEDGEKDLVHDLMLVEEIPYSLGKGLVRITFAMHNPKFSNGIIQIDSSPVTIEAAFENGKIEQFVFGHEELSEKFDEYDSE